MLSDRKNKLAVIHIARKQLGLDDECYRALLWGAARIDSASDLASEAQYNAVLTAFIHAGYKPGKRGKVRDSQLAKCYALWCELHKAGAVRDKRWGAMEKWAAARLGARQNILRADQKALLIEELKAWTRRIKGGGD